MIVSNCNIDESKYLKPSYRQKGGEMKGSLYRGTASHAFTKKNIGSIPSKFETVLYPQSNSNKKGFGSNGFRFTVQASENPGPGAYIDPATHCSMRLVSDSYSKKGYGNGFISTSERFCIENYYPYQIPGPGTYKPLAPITNLKPLGFSSGSTTISEKYKRKTSSAFMAHKGRSKVEKKRYELGPGSYNISRSFIKDKDSRNTAAFRNTAMRFTVNKNTIPEPGPGPGQYNIDKEGLKRGASQGKLGVACCGIFRQPSGAKRIKVNLYDPFENVENEDKVTPGPGQYEGEITYKRSASNTRLCSSMFAPHEIIDRFGRPKTILKKELNQNLPGPGYYHKEENSNKKSTVGFVFKSDVKRNTFIKKVSGPGPAFYKMKSAIAKESKNINPKREWI